MRAVGRITRGALRRGRGGFALVAVILGLGLGFSTTALAGARRSDSAYDRLRAASRAPDAVVGGEGLDDPAMARLAGAPGVLGAARFAYTPVAPAPMRPGQDAGAFVGLDRDFLARVYRPFVVSGRLAHPGDAGEVVVNEALARAADLVPGRRVRLVAGFGPAQPLGHVTVVGIVRGVFDVGANAGNASILLSRRFLDAHREQLQLGPQPAAMFRLRHADADLPRLQRALRRVVGHPVVVLSTSRDTDTIERFLAVQTIGLLVLALAAFVAVMAAALQVLSRRFDRTFADLPVLVACGLRPRQRYAIAALLAAAVAATGGAVAALASVLASPLVPTGFARKVDPASGVQIDVVGLVVVVGAAFVLTVVAAMVIARRHRVHLAAGPDAIRETRLGRTLPLIPRLGFQAALTPSRAPAGAAARAALVATTAAVAGIVAVIVFASSLHRLLDEPRLQGWAFDVAISQEGDTARALRRELRGIDRMPGVGGHGVVSVVQIDANGARSEAYAFDRAALALHPTMRAGRAPRTDDEMAAGQDALDRDGLVIGDTVRVRGTKGTARLRVVGSATYPELGNNSDLATGISITRATARRIGAEPTGTLALFRVDGHRGLRTVSAHRDEGEIVARFRAPRVRSLEDVGGMPVVLATFLGALGLVAVAHSLRRSSRERRHEFALLATLGAVRSELRAVVGWQSGVIAALAVVVGVPVGLLLGRTAWTAVADATGVVDELAVPVPTIVLVAVATMVVCLVIGILSARQAIRPRPGVTMRYE